MREVVRQATWSLTATLIARAGNLALAVLIARLAAPDQFGTYSFGFMTATLVSTLFSSPFATVITRSVAARQVGTFRITKSFARGALPLASATLLLPPAILVFGSSAISSITLNSPIAETTLRLASLYALFNGLFILVTAVQIGNRDFRGFTVATLINWTTAILVALVAVPSLEGIGGILAITAATLLGSMTSCRAALAWYRSLPAGNEAARLAPMRTLGSFYTALLFSGLSVGPINWAGVSLLARAGGEKEIANFQAHATVSSLVLILPAIIAQVALPHFSRTQGFGEKDQKTAAVVLAIGLSLGISFLILAFARPLASVVMGSKYINSYEVLVWQSLGAALAGTASVCGQFFVAASKVWLPFVLNIAAGVWFLLATALLVPDFGAIGLAWANCIEYAIHALTLALTCSVFLKLNMRFPLKLGGLGTALFFVVAVWTPDTGILRPLLSLLASSAICIISGTYIIARMNKPNGAEP